MTDTLTDRNDRTTLEFFCREIHAIMLAIQSRTRSKSNDVINCSHVMRDDGLCLGVVIAVRVYCREVRCQFYDFLFGSVPHGGVSVLAFTLAIEPAFSSQLPSANS